jgi:hypothetical protein
MRLTSRIHLFFALTLLVAPGARAADCCQGFAAVVESIVGKVIVRTPGAPNRTTVFPLDLLPAGSMIEVGPKSSATVLLLNGHRYELGQGAKATLTADSLSTKGPVRPLEPKPPLPRAIPIAGKPPQIAGAARVRGASNIRGLYPHDGAAALPMSVKLSFSRVPETSLYRVELEDEDGGEVLNLRTEDTDALIPDGTLKAGRRYFWRVQALGPAGAIAEGTAAFVTISEEDIERRAEFAKTMQNASDKAFALALLADVDFQLGLLSEAREEFLAALRLKPDEMSIQRALEKVQSALASEPGKR